MVRTLQYNKYGVPCEKTNSGEILVWLIKWALRRNLESKIQVKEPNSWNNWFPKKPYIEKDYWIIGI